MKIISNDKKWTSEIGEIEKIIKTEWRDQKENKFKLVQEVSS